MTRQEIECSMRQDAKCGFITLHGFMSWYGCGRAKALEMLAELEFIPGRGKAGNRYLCRDVARMLAEEACDYD